jgi:hypothetical protein
VHARPSVASLVAVVVGVGTVVVVVVGIALVAGGGSAGNSVAVVLASMRTP